MRPTTASRRLTVAASVAVLGLIVTPVQAQEEWPGFRGATGSAVADINLDVDTLAPEVVWRVSVGSGYSGVAVVDGRAITMFDDDGQYMIALDADTGEEIWRQRVADTYPGHDGSWDGPISTPVVHDGVVVALEPWGKLFALDAIDGEPMWSVHVVDDLGAPAPGYGFASSPMAVGDTLIINVGGESGTVIGFDLRSGEQRWSVGTESTANQSPVRMQLAGHDLVVTAGNEHLFGIDPQTGEVVLEYAHGGRGMRGSLVMVPLQVSDDTVFLKHSGDASQLARISARGDGLTAEQVWEARTIRSTYVPAVHHDGYVYGYNLRIFSCVDAATGELMWRSRDPGDGFPMIVDDMLMILTKDGTLHFAHTTPEKYDEIVGTPIFEELVWTPPSVAYGDVFARSQTEIARIDLNGGGGRAIAESDLAVARSLDPGDGEFGRFVRAVEAADDPAPLIAEFLATPRDYPIREGDTLVHFVYRGEATDMAITGDFLGTRQDVEMARVGDTDLYYYSTELLSDARLQYAFLRDGEMIVDPLNPLIEPTLIYSAEREHIFWETPLPMSELRMPEWRMPDHLRDPDPATRGTVETVAVPGGRGDIEFHVYLPHGYADSGSRYPVVLFHGPSPAALSMIPTALDNLIADGMRPVIAVWTDRQLRAGPRYVALLAEEVVPAVDAAYRTLATREGRVHVGTGLGALAALETAVTHPDMASGLAMLSIRALDVQWDPLMPGVGNAATNPLRVYVEWGVYGVRNPQEVWDNRAKTAARAQEFRELGYEVAGGEFHDGVGWASWRNRLDLILEALLPEE